MLTVTINKTKIQTEPKQTILAVAEANNIAIPTLCYHPDLAPGASCRLCVVEIKGKPGLHTACSTVIEDGMEIITDSPLIKETRKTNLELITAQHQISCVTCSVQSNCALKKSVRTTRANLNRYPKRKANYPTCAFGPALQFNRAKCIDCRNCVVVCAKQGINFLEIQPEDGFLQVLPSKKPNVDCIYCGQCFVHCPVGAFEEVSALNVIEEQLNNKNRTKKIVFQFAPSIRTSIGEEFHLPHGAIVTNQLSGALWQLGADVVFDVALGADVTTVEEAKELVERIKENKPLPMFTSCCPAWVKYVEFYHPELIPHLTTVRSPQIISGGIIKTHWAKQQGIKPEDIIVVSIMPCVSKKYEITRNELNINGQKPVDYVLTTRELATLLRKHKIDLAKVEPKPAELTIGASSSAGVIYGASGGVMESALRTAYFQLTGASLPKLEYEAVRGQTGIKKSSIKIGERTLQLAVVSGINNAQTIIAELKQDPQAYDYVEVMSCWGGCIGGGGQPLPTSAKIRQDRAQSLYNIDTAAKIREAHTNPAVQTIYQDGLINEDMIHKVCHTKFVQKEKEVS
ncbi:MAG: [FeFe] hydrogenase, group A [Patescibacteria group bacterium]|jgi:iron-only hydrogenase group A